MHILVYEKGNIRDQNMPDLLSEKTTLCTLFLINVGK